MNKKLVAAAIAAAMAAPAAFADVTVYGKLHMSIDSVDLDGGSYDGQTITSRASRLGFKGSEDLGNGLKAVWKIEKSIDMDEPGGFGDRSHYLGVAGSFGTIMLAGKENTPFKMSTGKMDFFGDTLADYNSIVGFEDNRANNAINYISPKFSGLQFSAMTVAGENTVGQDGLFDGYSVAATYNNAGIMAAIAYEKDEDLLFAKAEKKLRVGLGYKMNAFKVAAVYEKQNDIGGSSSGVDATLWNVSAAYSMGNNTIKATYGQNDTDGASEKDGWAIGVDHKMSKRTKVYALYTDSENKLHGESDKSLTGKAGDGFSLGMVHSF